MLKGSDGRVRPICRIFEVGNNFKLKSNSPLLLVSNVLYWYTCP